MFRIKLNASTLVNTLERSQKLERKRGEGKLLVVTGKGIFNNLKLKAENTTESYLC